MCGSPLSTRFRTVALPANLLTRDRVLSGTRWRNLSTPMGITSAERALGDRVVVDGLLLDLGGEGSLSLVGDGLKGIRLSQRSLARLGQAGAFQVPAHLFGNALERSSVEVIADGSVYVADSTQRPSYKLSATAGTGVAGVSATPYSARPIESDRLQRTDTGAVYYTMGDGRKLVLYIPADTSQDVFSMSGDIAGILLPDMPFMDMLKATPEVAQEGWTYALFFIKNKCQNPTRFIVSQRIKPFADMILDLSYRGAMALIERGLITKEQVEEMIASIYPQGRDTPGFPALMREWRHFLSSPPEKLREYLTFDNSGSYTDGDFRLVNRGKGVYSIYEEETYIGDIDFKAIQREAREKQKVEHRKVSQLSRLALDNRDRVLLHGDTAIIPLSSGGLFTTEGTSGSIWAKNGRLVILDPPANIGELLFQSGIPLDAIDTVIETHGHEDHASGAMWIVTNSQRPVTVIRTPVSELIAQHRYEAMSLGAVKGKRFADMYRFQPMLMKQAMQLSNGLWIRANCTNHSVDTGGYIELYDTDPLNPGAILLAHFTIDTQARPEKVGSLHIPGKPEESVIPDPVRLYDIIFLPIAALVRGAKVIVDGGVDPLHNTIEYWRGVLQSIAHLARGEFLVNHASRAKVEAAGLRYFGSGLKDALFFDDAAYPEGRTVSPNRQRAVIRQAILADPNLRAKLTEELLAELVSKGRLREVKAGEVLVKKGDTDKKWHIVVLGELEVKDKQGNVLALRQRGMTNARAMVTGQPRSADVIAVTDTTVVEFEADETLKLLYRAGIVPVIIKLNIMRKAVGESVLESAVMKRVSETGAMDQVLIAGDMRPIKVGEDLMTRGAPADGAYFIVSGTVRVHDRNGDGDDIILGPGRIVGEMAYVDGGIRNATVTGEEAGEALFIPGSVIRENPNVLASFAYIAIGRTLDQDEN